jgi:predicted aspartyl protease
MHFPQSTGTVCLRTRALWRSAVGLLLLLTLTGKPAWSQETIYSWTDEKGVVHFSNSMVPPQHLKEAETAVASTRPTVRGGGGRDAISIPLVIINNDPSQKFVQATLEGGRTSRETLMLVDTGAQITVIDEDMAQDLDVEHVQDALLTGVTGTSRGWIGRLATFKIGEEEIRDLHVMVGPMPGRLLLGMDVLENLRLSVGLRSLHRAGW